MNLTETSRILGWEYWWSRLLCLHPRSVSSLGQIVGMILALATVYIFFMANRWGKMEIAADFIFLGSKITTYSDCSHEIERHLLLGRKAMTNLDSILKSRHYFTNKGLFSQGYGFSSSHIWMWELDLKEGWAPKNWCFWTVVLEKTRESLGLQRAQTSHIHWEDKCGSWSSNTLTIWCEELTCWKRPWCWERLKAGRERDDREQHGWMASLTQWPWVSPSCGRW